MLTLSLGGAILLFWAEGRGGGSNPQGPHSSTQVVAMGSTLRDPQCWFQCQHRSLISCPSDAHRRSDPPPVWTRHQHQGLGIHMVAVVSNPQDPPQAGLTLASFPYSVTHTVAAWLQYFVTGPPSVDEMLVSGSTSQPVLHHPPREAMH